MAQVLNVNVGFDSFDELRSALFVEYPALTVDGGLVEFGALPAGVSGSAAGEIAYPIKDFYLTNPIARASERLPSARQNC
jgi:NADH-quinone oxidoreductase subunit G